MEELRRKLVDKGRMEVRLVERVDKGRMEEPREEVGVRE